MFEKAGSAAVGQLAVKLHTHLPPLMQHSSVQEGDEKQMNSMTREPAAFREAHGSANADSNRRRFDRPADSMQSLAEVEGDVTDVPKQVIAAGLGARRNSGADAQQGDVPMPWWYTPRRLLVGNHRS
jgi:hypothetical protein